MNPFRFMVGLGRSIALVAALLTACGAPTSPMARHIVEPIYSPWRQTGEQQALAANLSLAWHAIILTDRYTVVVYTLAPTAPDAPGPPLRPSQPLLRVRDDTVLEAEEVVSASDWSKVSVGVVRFGPRPPGAAYLQLEIPELVAGSEVITGPWRLRALTSDQPDQDNLATRHTFASPTNDYLTIAGVRISYNGPGLYLGDMVGEWQAANASARATWEAMQPGPFDSPPGTPPPTLPLPLSTPAPRPYYQTQTPVTPTPVPPALSAGVQEALTLRLEDQADGQVHFVYIEINEDGIIGTQTFGGQALVPRQVAAVAASAEDGCWTGPPRLPPGHTFGSDLFVSLEDARARLPFPLLVPAQSPAGGTLVSVELNTETPSAVALHYDNGVEIVQSYVPEAGDGRDRLPPGNWLSRLTDVNDIPAVGHDPGVQHLSMGDCDRHYPGVIAWYGELSINHIYGDLPLEELRRIAESLTPYEP